MSEFDPLTDYVRVSKNLSNFVPEKIVPITPVISKVDRQIGEIVRYFVRFNTHSISADITEVDKKSFLKLKKNKFYTITSIRWLVSGPLDDLEKSDILIPGVLTANKKSVELGDEELPGLADYITDYQRFWQ